MSRISKFAKFSLITWILFAFLVAIVGMNSFGFNLQGEINRQINYDKDPRSDSDIELRVTMIPPSTDWVAGTQIAIDDIKFNPKESDISPNELCIKQIRVLENIFPNSNNLMGSFFIFTGNYPVCYKIARGAETSLSTTGLAHPEIYQVIDLVDSSKENSDDIFSPLGHGVSITARNGFVYPYDSYWFEYALLLTYNLRVDGVDITSDKTVAPKIHYVDTDDVTDWNVQIYDSIQSSGNSTAFELIGLNNISEFRTIGVYFSRPIFYRIIYPIIILILLALIILLSFLNNVSDFFQGTLAVLFGMFGLKSFLIPSSLNLRTMLDVIIIGLYFALGISLSLFLINKYYFGESKKSVLVVNDKISKTNAMEHAENKNTAGKRKRR